jgi:molecular chaperone GrpE (heat shock protein)
VILAGGMTRMPIIKKKIEKIIGKPAEGHIDPMYAAALGAAIIGAQLEGEVRNILRLDVMSLSLGIEIPGGTTTKIIERNTCIPVHRSQMFTTGTDNQTAITIHVVQGEKLIAQDNVSLGVFHFVGIPPAHKGVPRIEVGLDVDARGHISISAKDLDTGNLDTIYAIKPSTKLSKKSGLRSDRSPYQHNETKTKEEKRTILSHQEKSNESDVMELTRLQVDFENYRERMERQLKEVGNFSEMRLVGILLPVLDELGLAVIHAENSVSREVLLEGLRMITKNFTKRLENEGLKEIEALGRSFNPTLHEAVETVNGNRISDESLIIVEEVRRGYLFRDKLLRPTLAKVALKPENDN